MRGGHITSTAKPRTKYAISQTLNFMLCPAWASADILAHRIPKTKPCDPRARCTDVTKPRTGRPRCPPNAEGSEESPRSYDATGRAFRSALKFEPASVSLSWLPRIPDNAATPPINATKLMRKRRRPSRGGRPRRETDARSRRSSGVLSNQHKTHVVTERAHAMTGTELIQGIVLEFPEPYEAQCHPEAFSKMSNLRLLVLSNVHLPRGLKCFSSALKVLEWKGYPLTLPENLNDNETLEELNVSGTAIREVPSSIVHLKNLKRLYCIGCRGSTISWTLPLPFGINIKFGNGPEVSPGLNLPPSISHLASIQILNLSYCSLSPSMIPNDLGASMPSLKDLNLRGNSFGNVDAGISLLPFSSLTSLNILNLSDCFLRDGSIPDDLSNLSSLHQLNLMGNYFTNLPSKCLANLPGLELLWINSCPNLQSLPELPPNLERLDASDSVSLEESLSDPQHLWSLFASLDLQRSDEEGHVVLQIPGVRFHHAVSIVASIPDCWRSSEWSGIAMCVVVEGQVWEDLWERVIFWSSKCLDEDEWPKRIYGYDVQGSVDRPQLFIRFLPFTHDNCWQYVHGEKKQLQFLLATKTRPRKGAHHSDQGPTRKLEITKCGWRALCKEDVQEYWRISASREE
ncbi:hypothetical protein Fmac_016876 [Flemingia macrophylla]|uniref:Uncharacterized protein n=1 Tax=Flemingia macrophylla TaxID=520843 RepID=A0ABD1MIQ2_9FABA